MKTNHNVPLKADSQTRLTAYATAAGLGAFLAGQNAGAQVTKSPAFDSYPVTLIPGMGAGTYGSYFYLNIDGGAAPQFNLTINAPIPDDPTNKVSQFIDLVGQSTNDIPLTPIPADPYLVSFLGGTTINSDNAAAPTYQPRLAISYLVADAYGGFYNYLDSKYKTTGALGFQFVGSDDGETHFGYMDVVVNTTTNSTGQFVVESVVIQDMYYEATPNAAITVPIEINITSITVDDGNAVTINFTSNDEADPSLFALETSPALGASADWTIDSGASISILISARNSAGIDVATYQITTTATGGASQFYRIVEPQ